MPPLPLGWRTGASVPKDVPPAEYNCLDCSCITASEYNRIPQLDTVNQQLKNVTCPNGQIPENQTLDELRVEGYYWNLSCFPDNKAPVFTIVDESFDPSNARLCHVCPRGYGPDPQCLRQPIPLPSFCCYPGRPCIKSNGTVAGFPGNGSHHWVNGLYTGDFPRLVVDSDGSSMNATSPEMLFRNATAVGSQGKTRLRF
ncbi:MAG: hypothetical protein M1814_003136 [Vezdaea aestivalis]|nr:MAG: hypothetical protein M1814_003136 [Vezdaea aestivalis]